MSAYNSSHEPSLLPSDAPIVIDGEERDSNAKPFARNIKSKGTEARRNDRRHGINLLRQPVSRSTAEVTHVENNDQSLIDACNTSSRNTRTSQTQLRSRQDITCVSVEPSVNLQNADEVQSVNSISDSGENCSQIYPNEHHYPRPDQVGNYENTEGVTANKIERTQFLERGRRELRSDFQTSTGAEHISLPTARCKELGTQEPNRSSHATLKKRSQSHSIETEHALSRRVTRSRTGRKHDNKLTPFNSFRADRHKRDSLKRGDDETYSKRRTDPFEKDEMMRESINLDGDETNGSYDYEKETERSVENDLDVPEATSAVENMDDVLSIGNQEVDEEAKDLNIDTPYTGPTHLIFEFPRGRKGKIRVTAEERGRLAERKYLNDSLIDFYFKYQEATLARRAPALELDSKFFSSFFFGRLRRTKPIDYEGVKSWTKGIDLFSKKFVFVPICDSCHWSLIIAANLDQLSTILSTDQPVLDEYERPRIIYLDSLDPSRGNAFGSALRRYLAEEWFCRKEQNSEERKRYLLPRFDKETLPVLIARVPVQSNEYDCGLYVLNSLKMFLNNEGGFMDKLLRGCDNLSEAYTHVDIQIFRHQLTILLDRFEWDWSTSHGSTPSSQLPESSVKSDEVCSDPDNESSSRNMIGETESLDQHDGPNGDDQAKFGRQENMTSSHAQNGGHSQNHGKSSPCLKYPDPYIPGSASSVENFALKEENSMDSIETSRLHQRGGVFTQNSPGMAEMKTDFSFVKIPAVEADDSLSNKDSYCPGKEAVVFGDSEVNSAKTAADMMDYKLKNLARWPNSSTVKQDMEQRPEKNAKEHELMNAMEVEEEDSTSLRIAVDAQSFEYTLGASEPKRRRCTVSEKQQACNALEPSLSSSGPLTKLTIKHSQGLRKYIPGPSYGAHPKGDLELGFGGHPFVSKKVVSTELDRPRAKHLEEDKQAYFGIDIYSRAESQSRLSEPEKDLTRRHLSETEDGCDIVRVRQVDGCN